MEMVGTSWPFALGTTAPAADELLLQRAASGDLKAFDRVWHRHTRLLRSIAFAVLHCNSHVDDVLHDAWSTAWARCPSYTASRGSALRWLRTIVRNKSIDRLRVVRRELAHAPQFAHWLAVDRPAEHSGYDRLVAGETAHRIAAALAQLTPVQARAIRCAYFDGLSHPEIATLLGVPLGTTKAHIRRGLEKLRSVLRSSLPSGLGIV